MLSDLAVIPFSEDLRRISFERRSGDLQVLSGTTVKTVFFDHGRLVFAASNRTEDRLGESLVEIGRITEREYEAAMELMRLRRQRFGEALVQSGVMRTNELGRSVAKQVKRIVLSLFALQDGAVQFEERPCAIPPEYMVNLSLHRTLYEGIRRMTSEDLVLRGIGDLSTKVGLADVPPFRFSIERCSQEESDILQHCRDRFVSLVRLLDAAGGLTLPAMRAAYALLASGILRTQDAADESLPVIQADEEGFLLSSMQRRDEGEENAAQRREIEDELMKAADDAVPSPAGEQETRRQLRRKLERFLELHAAVRNDEELRTNVELILGRTYVALHPLETAPVPTTARDSEPTPASPVSGAPEAAGTMDASGVHSTPENLLTWGNLQLTISDYATAVRTFARLVDLEPNVANYRLRLATAMALWPQTAKHAEREFHEALRLDPNSADIRYQLAIYYKTMKLRGRALEQLRLALSINPSHARAREELETLSPKDSALTSLKKLFR
jgi:tetratricopeptide (TPR) repeat protein